MSIPSIVLGLPQLIALTPLLSGFSPLSLLTPLPNIQALDNVANLSGAEVDYLPLVSDRRTPLQTTVPEIAQQVTVRVLSTQRAGSGVIIARRGPIHTVLTCDHVVADNSENQYTILTADGAKHSARQLKNVKFGDTDLALVQFTSQQSYRVALTGDSETLEVGDQVYASGFPNWRWINENAVEDTRDWGLKAFRLTTGTLEMISAKSLLRGYQLGYSNEVEDGMSGGPVLNSKGQLIGINGRLKYPQRGIEAYTFADGTAPSSQLFEQMEALSWAIPVATFQQKVGRLSGLY